MANKRILRSISLCCQSFPCGLWDSGYNSKQQKSGSNAHNRSLEWGHNTAAWITLCRMLSLWLRIDSIATNLKQHSCKRERWRGQVWEKVVSDHCCSVCSAVRQQREYTSAMLLWSHYCHGERSNTRYACCSWKCLDSFCYIVHRYRYAWTVQ